MKRKVWAVRVGKKPEIEKIEMSLEGMQEFVGGYIEMVPMGGNVMMVCNEEGKLLRLPENVSLGGDVIHGDIFFMKSKGDKAEDITEKDIKKIKEKMVRLIKVEL